MLVALEYDLRGVLVRRVVDGESRQLGQNLPGGPVTGEMVEHGLCGDDVVVAILGHLLPLVLGYGLVPGKTEFLVMDPELDLPLLEAHLVSGRCEVVHIGIGNIVRLAKERVPIAVDDPLAQPVQLEIAVPEISCVEDMVVVSSAVEADELHLEKLLDLLGRRVDHPHARGPVAVVLPVHEEQVREHLDVEEDDPVIGIWIGSRFRRVVRLELHLTHEIEAVVRLMRAVVGEHHDLGHQIAHVVGQPRRICVVEDLLYEIHAGLRSRMDLLPEVPLDEVPQTPLALNRSLVDHLVSLLQRQPARNMSDG